MINKLLLIFGVGLILVSCKENNSKVDVVVEETDAPKEMTLVKIWESDTVFTTAESVIYDAVTDVIYVSNIDGEPWAEDGQGSIGRLALDGTVIDAKWVDGLHCPKGMGIVGGKLYVTDSKQLVEIDIASGEIVTKYDVPGCEGLNDVTTTADGIVYFTDSRKGAAHMLKDGVVSTITENLGGSNGIFVEDDRLLLGTWADSSLVEYVFSDNSLNVLATDLPQPDGIEAVGDGGYLVSSWSGMIHYVKPDGSADLLLNTSVDEIGTADIDYVQDKDLLLIPTFYRNTVSAYSLSK